MIRYMFSVEDGKMLRHEILPNGLVVTGEIHVNRKTILDILMAADCKAAWESHLDAPMWAADHGLI